MNESQDNTNQNAFAELGRSLGRSRGGQLAVAIAVAALFTGLAYAAWHARDLAATVLSIGLLVYGFQSAWRLLPISSATRARWVREQQIAGRHPAFQYRGLLWAGIGIAIADLWRSGFTAPFDYSRLIVPSVFIVVGAISYILCQRFIRNERNA